MQQLLLLTYRQEEVDATQPSQRRDRLVEASVRPAPVVHVRAALEVLLPWRRVPRRAAARERGHHALQLQPHGIIEPDGVAYRREVNGGEAGGVVAGAPAMPEEREQASVVKSPGSKQANAPAKSLDLES